MSYKYKKIFALESDDGMMFFSSKNSLESYVEMEDVKNNVYPIVYDTDGNVYKFDLKKSTPTISSVDGSKVSLLDLMKIIENFLPIKFSSYSMDELLSTVERYVHF